MLEESAPFLDPGSPMAPLGASIALLGVLRVPQPPVLRSVGVSAFPNPLYYDPGERARNSTKSRKIPEIPGSVGPGRVGWASVKYKYNIIWL